MKLNEHTLIPMGMAIGLISTVIAGAVAWGSIRTEVRQHEERLNRQEDTIRENRIALDGLQRDLMAQVLILRQDVSEIKGRMKAQ